MSVDEISFRHLRAFVTVELWGSFLAAADELGYAQATISQQISTLEKSLGHPLLKRHGGAKAATLTTFGHAFVVVARQLLADAESAVAELDGLASGTHGTLRIGTYQSASVKLLPVIITALHAERPLLNISVVESYRIDELLHGLQSQQLDVALMADFHKETRIDSRAIGEDPWVLVLTPADEERLRPARLSNFSLSVLEGEYLVGQHESEDQRHIEVSLRAAGVTPRYAFRSHDNGVVQAMVRAGLGPAIMTKLSTDAHDPGTRIIDLSHAIPPRTMKVAIKRGSSHSPATLRFIELAHSIGRDLLA
jgi:DNA-binding transcriptional LysR family regulator